MKIYAESMESFVLEMTIASLKFDIFQEILQGVKVQPKGWL